MVPPFEVSLFADPAGSFTTAGAMVAKVERLLRAERQRELAGLRVAVFGATGVVGFAAGVIAALEGAAGDAGRLRRPGARGTRRRARSSAASASRVAAADGSSEAGEGATSCAQAEVVFCAGRAGVQVLIGRATCAPRRACSWRRTSTRCRRPASKGWMPGRTARSCAGGALGIGALAIGDVKYRTQLGLFRRMIESDKPVSYDFRDAFALARDLAA